MQKVTDVWQIQDYGCYCPECGEFCVIDDLSFSYYDNLSYDEKAEVVCEKCKTVFLAVKPED